MHVQIDEAGRDHESARIKFLVGPAFNFIGRSNLGNPTAFEQQVHRRIRARRRINEMNRP